jgi:hypothetical protein
MRRLLLKQGNLVRRWRPSELQLVSVAGVELLWWSAIGLNHETSVVINV